MAKLTLGHIIFFLGLTILLITIGAGIVQAETALANSSPQLVWLSIAAILCICGLVMWVSKKDLAVKNLPSVKPSNFSLGHLLVVIGTGLAVLALGADLFNIGNDLKIGEKQIMGALIGVVIAGVGFFIWGTVKDHLLVKLIKRGWLSIKSPFVVLWSKIHDLSPEGRTIAALVMLAVGVVGIFFYNNVYPRLDIDSGVLKKLDYFHPSSYGLGADCRVGIYRQSYMALHNADLYVEHTKMSDFSNYPPFTHVFFMPLQVLKEYQAYKLIVILLFLTNIIVLGMMTIIIRDTIFTKFGWGKSPYQTPAIFLFLAILFYNLTGYPFLFSIERGNYDIIAFFFSILSVYLLIKKPEAMWWQIITLSVAVHLKIYPAVLFLALLIKHGKKLIIPTMIVNFALLLSLGVSNAIKFFKVMFTYSLAPDVWAGNHSGFSFADLLITSVPSLQGMRSAFEWLFTLIPLAVWGLSIYVIIKSNQTATRDVQLFMVSIPLMLLFPSTSHDYALVIIGTAVLGLASILLVMIRQSKGVMYFIQLLVMLMLLGLIDRSTYLFSPSLQVISNKYPWVLLLSILMLVALSGFNRLSQKEKSFV